MMMMMMMEKWCGRLQRPDDGGMNAADDDSAGRLDPGRGSEVEEPRQPSLLLLKRALLLLRGVPALSPSLSLSRCACHGNHRHHCGSHLAFGLGEPRATALLPGARVRWSC